MSRPETWTTRPAGDSELLSRSCVQLGQTIVLVTHEARAAAYADRVLVVRDGLILDEITSVGARTTTWPRPGAARHTRTLSGTAPACACISRLEEPDSPTGPDLLTVGGSRSASRWWPEPCSPRTPPPVPSAVPPRSSTTQPDIRVRRLTMTA